MSDLLQLVVSEGASDLHIRVNTAPVIRVHGILHRVEGPILSPEDTEELMRSITSEDHIQHVRERGGADFGFAFGDMARFRVSVFKEKGNFALVLRQIPSKMLTMEQIGQFGDGCVGLGHARAVDEQLVGEDLQTVRSCLGQPGSDLGQPRQRRDDCRVCARIERHGARGGLAGAREVGEPHRVVAGERSLGDWFGHVQGYDSGSSCTRPGSTVSTTACGTSPRA